MEAAGRRRSDFHLEIGFRARSKALGPLPPFTFWGSSTPGSSPSFLRSRVPLRLVNADGTNQRVISSANTGYAESPLAWSPDSKWLVAERLDGTLHVIEVATGTVLPVRNGGAYGNLSWK